MGFILGMHSASERQHYNVTSSPIGCAHTQNDLCHTLSRFLKFCCGCSIWSSASYILLLYTEYQLYFFIDIYIYYCFYYCQIWQRYFFYNYIFCELFTCYLTPKFFIEAFVWMNNRYACNIVELYIGMECCCIYKILISTKLSDGYVPP